MADDNFNLKYRNYSLKLFDQIKDLLKYDEFMDCILATNGQQLRAHKLVLSSSSSVFAVSIYF